MSGTTDDRAGAAAAAALRDDVKRYYSERLKSSQGCCGDAAVAAVQVEDVPSYGCGEPTLFADLRPGEHVLDLGSGAGLDAFRAAGAVGQEGRVTGVDMTPAMLERAREGAQRLGIGNVRFVEGIIEALPLPDASVDVVLSNCVINLSADKRAVFSEAFRVLRPAGRLAVSDVLRRTERQEPASREGWCACVDGAETAQRYRGYLQGAGFSDIRIEPAAGEEPAREPYSAVVRATRPAVRAASEADMAAVEHILEDAGLPLAGLGDARVRLFVATDPSVEDALRAVVGYEHYGDAALLRSLAVREEARGRGLGVALIHHAENLAREAGVTCAFAVTTTIGPLLERLGYRSVSRTQLPSEIRASPELQGACPDSAAVYLRRLTS